MRWRGGNGEKIRGCQEKGTPGGEPGAEATMKPSGIYISMNAATSTSRNSGLEKYKSTCLRSLDMESCARVFILRPPS